VDVGYLSESANMADRYSIGIRNPILIHSKTKITIPVLFFAGLAAPEQTAQGVDHHFIAAHAFVPVANPMD